MNQDAHNLTDNSLGNYFLQDPSLLQKVNEKQNKKIILYDLPQIDDYRRLNKPVVSEEKKIMIKQKLDLQQESLQQTKERQKRNQYFLNYSDNPFINLEPHLVKHYGKQKTQQLNKNQIYDIVYELNAMRSKNFKPQFLKMKEDFNNLKKDTDLLSKKIVQNSSKKEGFDYFNVKLAAIDDIIKQVFETGRQIDAKRQNQQNRNRSSTATPQQIKQNRQAALANPILNELPQNPLSFNEIIALKEQNFFMKNKKKMNIFKFAFNNNDKDIIGKQLLNKCYFNFTSMVQKLQKIKIPIYRDISRMARRIMLDISTGKQDRFDYIDSYELSFKTNNLQFQDIMSVASGRFSPDFVSRTTNFDADQNMIKQKSQSSSQQQEQQIYYDENTNNVSVRFYNRGEEQQQIINYKNLESNAEQVRYERDCQRHKRSISMQLQEKQKLISETIQDKYLHSIINTKVKNQLNQFVQKGEKDLDVVDVDRLIRKNKMHKNKNVSIKLEKILETFKLKDQHQDVIDKLGKQGVGLGLESIDQSYKASPEFLSNQSKKKKQVYRYDQRNLTGFVNDSKKGFDKTPKKGDKDSQNPQKTVKKVWKF